QHVTVILDANGISRTFGYDSDGRVNEVTEPSGHWKTEDGKHWVNLDSKDKDHPWVWEGDVLPPTPDGRYISRHGDVTLTRFANGSEMSTDKDGNIVNTKSKDGYVREYTYGKGPDDKRIITKIVEIPPKPKEQTEDTAEHEKSSTSLLSWETITGVGP